MRGGCDNMRSEHRLRLLGRNLMLTTDAGLDVSGVCEAGVPRFLANSLPFVGSLWRRTRVWAAVPAATPCCTWLTSHSLRATLGPPSNGNSRALRLASAVLCFAWGVGASRIPAQSTNPIYEEEIVMDDVHRTTG